MDRIYGLPQPIQLQILAFLEEKEIARAAVLSKEWRSIVQFRPVLESVQSNILNYLDEKEIARAAVLSKAWRSIVQTRPVFNQRLFKRKRGSYNLTKVTMIESEDLCFMNHVNDFFQKHDRIIPKFSLVTELHDTKRCSHYLDRWIQQLLEAKVKVLCLNLKQWRPTYGYVLSPSVFSSETVTNLRLRQCNLGQCNYMRLPNVIELTLRVVTLSQDSIDEISSGCPNLEILRLIECKGFSSICVTGLARLYEVELNLGSGSGTSVKVVAPMLRVFKVGSSPEVELLACESTLRNLSLSRVSMTTEGLRDFVSKFLVLEELVLADLDMQSIEIPNQKFLKLEVRRCSCLEKRVRIDAPNLRVLKYYGNNLSFDPVISSISPNCVIEIEIYTRINKSDMQSFRDLFLALSGFSDMKFILEDFNREPIICQVLDENVIKKIFDSETTMFRSADVVRFTRDEHTADHLFGSGFGQKTISIVSRDQQSNRKFLEVLRKETMKKKEEKPNCCGYKFDKCWRHWLHDAEMVEEETSHWTLRSALFRCIVAMGYQTARIKLQRKSYV